MKTPSPLFIDEARLLYKEFHHFTPNGNAIYLYIFERLERFDEHANQYKPYPSYNAIKALGGDTINPNTHQGDIYTIHYTRKNKNSWDFKLLDIQ